jgi:O-antigen ligase
MTSLVAISRLFSGFEAWPKHLIYRSRLALVLIAVGLPLTSAPYGRTPLPFSGSVTVFAADLLVLSSVGLWALERILSRETTLRLSSPILGWPLVLFALVLIPGILRGHERYGLGLVGQPVRLVLYAAIALSVLGLRSRDVFWGLTAVLYAGTVWQLVLAGYSLVSGESQTGSDLLSTGGTRVLSLGAGMYIAAALLAALLNVEYDHRRRWLHLSVAGLALVAEALTFGRTTFIALAVIVPVTFWVLPGMRSFVLRKWKVWIAFAVVVIAGAALTPSIGQTLIDRVSANPLHDSTVRWRVGAFEAALSGFRSGQWEAAQPPGQSNRLSDPGFERGIEDWNIQGGQIASVDPAFPTYGKRALRFATVGQIADEGPYTRPVLTQVGQTWSFSIWLRGERGGEKLNVGIWEYGTAGSHTGYTNLPVVLTRKLTQYKIQVTVSNPETTHVRAVLRTRSDPQATTVYADEAYLMSVSPLERNGVAPNVFTNPSFEGGTDVGWSTQGGELSMAPQTDPRFGQAAARLTTLGDVVDEGMYSEPIAAEPGDDWAFSIWMQGTTGFEVVDVALWEYDANGETTETTVAPVVLNTEPRQYYVQTRIEDKNTTTIRALVRTWGSPQQLNIVVDDAVLTRDPVSRTESNESAVAGKQDDPAIKGPLLGLGFGRSFNYIWSGQVYHLDGDPHNSFIWILAGGGVFALAALLLLMAVFLRDALRRLRVATELQRALILWAIGTWFIFMVNTLTGPILSDPNFLLTIWIAMLLPALVRPSRGDSRR